jgi:hypothetical protein
MNAQGSPSRKTATLCRESAHNNLKLAGLVNIIGLMSFSMEKKERKSEPPAHRFHRVRLVLEYRVECEA